MSRVPDQSDQAAPPPDDVRAPPRGVPLEPDATGARRRAVALAGHTGDEVVARAALADPAPGVRATALGALVRLDRLTLADVALAFDDPEPTVRARAAEVAIPFGPAALSRLRRATADPDERVVEAACFALGEVGAAAGPAVGDLVEVAGQHREPLCREAAVAALGAIGDEAGLAAILAAGSDKPAVRRRAVLALAPFSGPDVDAALAAALEDRDWQVRQAAEDLTDRSAT
jgi:HEAT repeat protein